MFALGPVLMPRGSHPDAAGNDATCSMQGWFLQTGYGQPIYNAAFMVYFAMQIMTELGSAGGARSSSKGALFVLGRCYEPVAHVLCIGFAVGTATAGLFLPNGLYNATPIIGRCLIVEHPFFCSKNPRVECERGWNYRVYEQGFQTIPTLAALAVQLAALLAICAYVVGHDIKMRKKHRVRMRQSGVSSEVAANDSLSREVVVMAGIYGAVFFNTYFWSAIIFLKGYPNAKFWLKAVAAAFQPSQGLFNFLIQLRPRFVELRKANGDWRWWKVVWVAVVHGCHVLPSTSRRSSPVILKPLRSFRRMLSTKHSSGGLSDRGQMDGSVSSTDPSFLGDGSAIVGKPSARRSSNLSSLCEIDDLNVSDDDNGDEEEVGSG